MPSPSDSYVRVTLVKIAFSSSACIYLSYINRMYRILCVLKSGGVKFLGYGPAISFQFNERIGGNGSIDKMKKGFTVADGEVKTG